MKKKNKDSPFFEDVFKILDMPIGKRKIHFIEEKMEEIKVMLQRNKIDTDLEAVFKKGKYNKRYLWRF